VLHSCTLCFEEGHLPHTMSLMKASTLGRTQSGRLSIIKKKETRFEPRFMVCSKTQPVHLVREAESARRAAALRADRGEAVALRKKAALRTDVTSLPPAARAAFMTRVADALTGPHARAALVNNPRGAAYHKAYAGGIAGGMSENTALLFAGATQAGIEFGESAPGEIPNSDVVRRGLHKRLEKASATKHKGHVDRIVALMSTLSGPVGSVRLNVGGASSPVALTVSFSLSSRFSATRESSNRELTISPVCLLISVSSFSLHRDARNLRNGSTGQPGVAGASTPAPRVGRVGEHQLTGAEMRGGPGLASASDEDVALNRLGPTELSESLGVFVYGPSPSTQRSGSVGKARAGMEAQFVLGHNVSESSLTVTAVAALILSKWGDAGEDQPSIGDLPAGLVYTVTRWVSSRR